MSSNLWVKWFKLVGGVPFGILMSNQSVFSFQWSYIPTTTFGNLIHRDARGPPSIGRPQIHCSQKFTQNRLNTEIYSTGPRGVLYGHLNRTRKPTINKKIIEEIYFAILRADRCPAEWVLRSRKKTRGALERVFTNFFAQTGKKTHNHRKQRKTLKSHSMAKNDHFINFWDQKTPKSPQQSLSRASVGPQNNIADYVIRNVNLNNQMKLVK